MIFSFEDSEKLLKYALPTAKKIAALKQSAKAAKVPVVYVNDNYGRWQSDFNRLIKHCLEKDVPGKPIVELLQPDNDDYFVLKPKHSGFYSSTLDVLLVYLQVKTVVLTGFAGNICVLFTANDAYMRDYDLYVPGDCVASNYPHDNEHASQQMQSVLKANIAFSTEIDWEKLKTSL